MTNTNSELLAATLALLTSQRAVLARFEAEFAKRENRDSMLWAVRVDEKRARIADLEVQVLALAVRQ